MSGGRWDLYELCRDPDGTWSIWTRGDPRIHVLAGLRRIEDVAFTERGVLDLDEIMRRTRERDGEDHDYAIELESDRLH